MIFHIIVGGAGSGAFSAKHTFKGIDTADAIDELACKIVFHVGSVLLYSESFGKQLGEVYGRKLRARVDLKVVAA